MPRSGTVYLHNLIASCFTFKKVEPSFFNGIHTEPPEWNPYKADETYMGMADGEALCAHYPLNEKIRLLIEEDDVLPIYLYRDPRDVAVSTTLFIKYVLTHHPLHKHIANLSESDALALILAGGIVPTEDDSGCGYIIYEGMKYFCDEAISWIKHPKVASIKYENLTTDTVGTLVKVLNNVEVEIDPVIVRGAADRLSFRVFANGRAQGEESKSSHFRKGVIGDYKLHFSALHRAICKMQFGSQLIDLEYEKDLLW